MPTIDNRKPQYGLFYAAFLVLLLAIPGAAFLLGNGWLSTGILVFVVTSWIGWPALLLLVAYAVWTWVHTGFSLSQYGTFFLFCGVVSYLFFRMARAKILVAPKEGED
jgi:hypothetical protein